MDAETSESVAGVVRLLRRAAALAWAQADARGPGSPRQIFASGVDLAADEARNLLKDGLLSEGPVPVGDDPASLVRSVEQLMRHICVAGAPGGLHRLQTVVVGLMREASAGANA